MGTAACVFAGQGAQAVGMGRDLAEAFPECRAVFDRADQVLGFSLSRLCFEGPLEELTRSSNCQPAIFVASVAGFEALRRTRGAAPFAAAAGLSLGEWTALYVGGALGFEDTLRVLEARGRFMQAACEEREGGMVSVLGLPAEKLQEVCAATGVQIANLNSAEQTVLSGPRQAVAAAEALAKQAGAKRTVVLKVAGAFHSALMQSAADKLQAFLAGIAFAAPRMPVVANVTGRPHGAPEEIRAAMVRQVVSPVRWVSCVEWMKGQGIREYFEFGPGNVLAGLIKRIDREAAAYSVPDAEALRKLPAA
jgi:[acyl-carrier-protein] S-malonyltransferase